jgi:hypothetical protein
MEPVETTPGEDGEALDGPYAAMDFDTEHSLLVPMTGTNTYGQEGISALLHNRGLPQRAVIHADATLRREPDDPVRPAAAAVRIDGYRVGHLTEWVAHVLKLTTTEAHTVPVQLFTAPQDGKVRTVGFAWIGDELPPVWRYSEDHRAPVTSEDKSADRRAWVARGLAGGGKRAERFRAGMVDGVHYLELVEPIKQLKREGRLEEALELCYKAMTGAENSAGDLEPPSFYAEQAAIVLRKLGRREEEMQVLRRHLARSAPEFRDGGWFGQRLAKLEAPR